jgi:hypothetical protein
MDLGDLSKLSIPQLFILYADLYMCIDMWNINKRITGRYPDDYSCQKSHTTVEELNQKLAILQSALSERTGVSMANFSTWFSFYYEHCKRTMPVSVWEVFAQNAETARTFPHICPKKPFLSRIIAQPTAGLFYR